MRILIIGGGGLIGQAIAHEHLSKGDDVYIYDTKVNSYNDYSNLIGLDITEQISKFTLSDIMKHFKFDIISDQACLVGVCQSQYDIYSYINNNIGHTAYMLSSILESKHFPKKILLAGSMGPYGEGIRHCNNCGINFYLPLGRSKINIDCISCGKETILNPIREDTQKYPQSFYALSKQTQEETIKLFCNIYNVNAVSLRYFSVYGINSNPNNPYTGVLSIIANKILNSDVVELNEDGTQLRDLIRNTFCAEAHYKVCNYENENLLDIFNIGTGKAYSLKYIAEKMLVKFNSNKNIVFNNSMRKGDIKDSIADNSYTEKVLGFKAENLILKDIDLYVDFIENNVAKFRKIDTCKQADAELKKNKLLR